MEQIGVKVGGLHGQCGLELRDAPEAICKASHLYEPQGAQRRRSLGLYSR